MQTTDETLFVFHVYRKPVTVPGGQVLPVPGNVSVCGLTFTSESQLLRPWRRSVLVFRFRQSHERSDREAVMDGDEMAKMRAGRWYCCLAEELGPFELSHEMRCMNTTR